MFLANLSLVGTQLREEVGHAPPQRSTKQIKLIKIRGQHNSQNFLVDVVQET